MFESGFAAKIFLYLQVSNNDLGQGKKKGFVSRTRAHKYGESLLPHSPTRGAQFLAFLFNCQVKSEKKFGHKAAAKKKKKKKVIPMFQTAHFQERKKKA